MDEYISKQGVLDYFNGYLHSLGDGGADTLLFDRGQRRSLINSIQDILAVKAADVQPVKHGRWERRTSRIYACTECTNEVTDRQRKNYSFCPYCGSKQDLGGD